MKRILYLGYYVQKMDWNLLRKFYSHMIKVEKKFFIHLLLDNFWCVFRYNISILEYFQFQFFNKNSFERSQWAGTGFMYETISKLNPSKTRFKLEDKLFFLNYYSDFVAHSFASLDQLKSKEVNFDIKKKLVLKNSKGQCGRGVEVYDEGFVTEDALLKRLVKMKNNMVEEYIYQHDDLEALSPSGLNTLRVITIINSKGGVDILGVRLRISINSHVDNLAAGNVAAPVDLESGMVIGPGVYSDITKKPEYTHPVTGIKIVGFLIPNYHEALALARNAALFDKDNRSVGWDIAISNKSVSLIEGNHNWCKLLWQLPVNKGLKSILNDYVN